MLNGRNATTARYWNHVQVALEPPQLAATVLVPPTCTHASVSLSRAVADPMSSLTSFLS